MPTPLEKIRDAAVNSSTPIEDLLRMGLVLAYQLNHPELQSWLDRELNGYGNDDVLPEYRKAVGTVYADFYDEFRQIHNAQIPSTAIPEQVREMVTCPRYVQPIGVYGPLIAGSKSGLVSRVPPEIAMAIQFFEGMQCSRAWVEVPLSQAQALLENVRNKLLRFVLEIQKINPEVGQPDAAPVPPAQVQQIYNQTVNVHGNVGNVGSGTNFSQTAAIDVGAGDFVGLEQFLKAQGLNLTQTRELRVAIDADRGEPNTRGIGPRTRAWLKALRETAQAAVAEIAARAIERYLGLPG